MAGRRLLAALLLAAACLGLTGCWDRRELEDTAFILALGLDPAAGNQLVVTAMVAVPGKLAGGREGTGGGKQSYVVAAAQAPGVVGALGRLQTFLGRQPSLLHCKVLVVGEALARRGLLGPVNELARFRQVRRTLDMIVARGRAAEFLETIKPNIEREPNRYIELLALSSPHSGLVPPRAQMHEFIARLQAGGADPLAYLAAVRRREPGGARAPNPGQEPPRPQTGGESAPESGTTPGRAPPAPNPNFLPGAVPRRGASTVDITGAAVFRGDRLAGMLTGEETRLLLMLRGQYYRGFFSLRDPAAPGHWVTLSLRRARPVRVLLLRRDQQVQVDARVDLEAELHSQSGPTDFSRPENRTALEAALGRQLAMEAAALHRKTQQWQADVFRYGERARRLFATWDEWEAFNWRRRWPQVRTQATFRVQLRRYGMASQPLGSG